MKIDLPAPDRGRAGALEAVLNARTTQRTFADRALTLGQVAQLLWAGHSKSAHGKRTTPSADALHPIQLYACGHSLAQGEDVYLYRYLVEGHHLERSGLHGIDRSRLEAAALGAQPWVANAPLIVVIAAELDAARRRFAAQTADGKRGLRYAEMEAGAVMQNLYLQATALALGVVCVAGVDEQAVHDCLALPATQRPLALICIGVPAP